MIVLRKQRYQDSKLIVEFLSSQHGKLKTISRISSSFKKKDGATAFELFNLYKIKAVQKAGSQENIAIKDITTLNNSFPNSDYFSFLFSSLWCELAFKTDFDESTGSQLFNLTIQLAEDLARPDNLSNQLKNHAWYLFNFLEVNSLVFNYQNCVQCGAETHKTNEVGELKIRKRTYSFTPSFGIVCDNCSDNTTGHLNSGFIKICCLCVDNKFIERQIPIEHLRDFITQILNFINNILRIQLRSQSIYYNFALNKFMA